MPDERIIMKVQVSLNSSDGKDYVLMYDQQKKYMGEDEAEPEILAIMQGRPKAFFYASLRQIGSTETETLVIEEEAPWQDW